MYRISQISNFFNYDENVVVTTIYAPNDNDEMVSKSIAFDKTQEEMDLFVKPWSLTTLSINTDIPQDELKKNFGQSFKRAYVRFIKNNLFYNYDSKLLTIDSCVEVCLDSSFVPDKTLHFHLHSDSPLPESEDFVKSMQLPNLVGYK